jgi:hypothetical protein
MPKAPPQRLQAARAVQCSPLPMGWACGHCSNVNTGSSCCACGASQGASGGELRLGSDSDDDDDDELLRQPAAWSAAAATSKPAAAATTSTRARAEWACAACTFINSVEVCGSAEWACAACEVCGSARLPPNPLPAGGAAAAGAAGMNGQQSADFFAHFNGTSALRAQEVGVNTTSALRAKVDSAAAGLAASVNDKGNKNRSKQAAKKAKDPAKAAEAMERATAHLQSKVLSEEVKNARREAAAEAAVLRAQATLEVAAEAKAAASEQAGAGRARAADAAVVVAAGAAHIASSAPGEERSEYEEQRHRNILRNATVLHSLGIGEDPAVTAARAAADAEREHERGAARAAAAAAKRERERAASSARERARKNAAASASGTPLPHKQGPRGAQGGIAPSLVGKPVAAPALPAPGADLPAALQAAPPAASRLTSKDLSEAQLTFHDSDDEELPQHNRGAYRDHLWQCVRPGNLNPLDPGVGRYSDAPSETADANYVWAKNLTNARRQPRQYNVQRYLVRKLSADPHLLSSVVDDSGAVKVTAPCSTCTELDFSNWLQPQPPAGGIAAAAPPQ